MDLNDNNKQNLLNGNIWIKIIWIRSPSKKEINRRSQIFHSSMCLSRICLCKAVLEAYLLEQSFSGQMNYFDSKILLFVYFRLGTLSLALGLRVISDFTSFLEFLESESTCSMGFRSSCKLSSAEKWVENDGEGAREP